MVRSVDVSRHMGVSKPSVCVAVNTLKKGGFLTMDKNYNLHLTEAGKGIAEKKRQQKNSNRRRYHRKSDYFRTRRN